MVVDGKALAKEVLIGIKKDLDMLRQKGIRPKLAIITLGHNSTWKTYVHQKIKLAKRLEISAKLINLQNPSEEDLLKTIEQLNNDNNIHGIIVQRPFSKIIDKQKVNDAIDPRTDVDGFRADSPYQIPVFLAVEKILQKISGIEDDRGLFIEWLQKKSIVIIGKGETAGIPIIYGLENLGLSPHVVDSRTQNTEEILKNADIVISAVGKKIVGANDLKEGVILIGVGLARGKDDKLRGDYDNEEIKNIASFYTPTPGGVGPLNLAYLFKNLIEAAKGGLPLRSPMKSS